MKKIKYGIPPPSNRAEFEHNIALSFEVALHKLENNQLDPGFVHMTLPRLKDLKFLPNGRIDFNSVDEHLRLESNMMHWMELMPPPEIKTPDEENE